MNAHISCFGVDTRVFVIFKANKAVLSLREESGTWGACIKEYSAFLESQPRMLARLLMGHEIVIKYEKVSPYRRPIQYRANS